MARAILRQMLYQDPVVYDWPKIEAKTLVLGGERDFTPDFPELARHLAGTIPGATLVLLPGIGHVAHLQAPELFYKTLLTFLDE